MTATDASDSVAGNSRPPLPDWVVDEAKDVPIQEVAERLHLSLKKAGGDLKGPCPACGGEDRFAITPAKNVYVCRHCGGGDGIGLVRKVMGVDFVSAVEFITGRSEREHIIDPAELDRQKQERAKKRARQAAYAEKQRQRARGDGYDMWKASKPPHGTLVEDYLHLRAIDPAIIAAVLDSKQVRFHPYLPYWGEDDELGADGKPRGKRELFKGPAMVSAVLMPDGRFGAAHRTWLDLDQPKGKPVILGPDGKPLSMKLGRGSKQGGAIRLVHQDRNALPSTMVMGEGIETTLSAAAVAEQLWGKGNVAAWCAVDLSNMAGKAATGRADQPGEDSLCFVCPSSVRTLIYLGDDGPDHKPTRTKLTRGLLRHKRRHAAYNIDLETRIAWAGEGKDFNDLVAGKGGEK